MTYSTLTLNGATLRALGSGALWYPDAQILTVSDLHLGKSERMARRTGKLLPPYETLDTLTRLTSDLETTSPKTVICLGDSFDDRLAEAALPDPFRTTLTQMIAGRKWVWIEGNHDPGPTELAGTHLASYSHGPLSFRHIADPNAGAGEVSGHYHPKFTLQTKGKSITRAAFLYDETRLILPAYGTYTGGLRSTDPAFDPLFPGQFSAIMTGPTATAIPNCQAAKT